VLPTLNFGIVLSKFLLRSQVAKLKNMVLIQFQDDTILFFLMALFCSNTVYKN